MSLCYQKCKNNEAKQQRGGRRERQSREAKKRMERWRRAIEPVRKERGSVGEREMGEGWRVLERNGRGVSDRDERREKERKERRERVKEGKKK